ncbi:MAG: hypothetical protein ACRETY_10765, partial [Steroidobacteraceae bacterium]
STDGGSRNPVSRLIGRKLLIAHRRVVDHHDYRASAAKPDRLLACEYDREFDGTNIQDFEIMIVKQCPG